MSNEMITAHDTLALLEQQNAGKYQNNAALTAVTTAGSYLPYIQVMGGNSNEVKRGKFPIGHLALVKNKNLIDLGPSCVAFLLRWRPKAMIYKPEVLSFYDSQSEAFKQVQATADQKDSNRGFGPEFLLWLPEHSELATMFLGNITGRTEAPNLIGVLNKERKCRLSCVFLENTKKGFSWHGVAGQPYDLDITNWPEPDLLKLHLDKFDNPPESTKEPVEAAETGSAGRG